MVILPKDVAPSQDASGNEGLVRDSLLKMVHNLGGHCYYEGATPNIYPKKIDSKKKTVIFGRFSGRVPRPGIPQTEQYIFGNREK